jgi:hypothetical protein
VVKGQRKMIIVPDDGSEPREYALPRGVHVNVHEGERGRAGEQLMDGPSNPHDILRVLGEKELQKYLVNEIQEVYGAGSFGPAPFVCTLRLLNPPSGRLPRSGAGRLRC